MRRFVVFAAAFASLSGCASTGGVLPPGGNTAYGSYPFRTAVNSTPPVALEGVVILLPDTVVVTLKNSKCTYQGGDRSSGGTFNYYCGDYSFSFSRANPLRQHAYRVTSQVWEQQRVCITYRENPRTKAEECSRYGTERVQRTRVITGHLSFTARDH